MDHLVDRASTSYTVGSWLDYSQSCNNNNNRYRLILLANGSALNELKKQVINSVH